MKVFVFFLALVACVEVITSSPVIPRQIDWDAVIDKWWDLRDVFMLGAQRILAIVVSENEQVGNVVKVKIETAARVATLLLRQLADRIGAEELPADEAKYHIGGLRGIMITMQEELEQEIALLIPVTAEQIRDVFNESFDALNIIAKEFDELLNQ